MSAQPQINQNAASIKFSALVFGAEPAILQPTILQSGFTYLPGYLNMIGKKVVGGVTTYPLYDSTDDTQTLYGVTYDNWLNTTSFAASQAPITFAGNTSLLKGNAGQTYVQSFTATTATSTTLTAVSLNTANIPIGTVLSGPGIVTGTTVTAIVSSTSLTISNATTASASAVAITAVTSAITTGNIAGSNSQDAYQATSVITNITSTAALLPGSLVTGSGIPANTTILEILSSTAILISSNVTATASAVTITTYLTSASNMLVDVATTQNPTTQFRYNFFVGANGGTVDIDAVVTANNAQLLVQPNGAIGIKVITFSFIGS